MRCGFLRDARTACLVSFVRTWRCKGPLTKALSKDATSIVMTAPKCYCARPAAVRVVKKDTHNKGRAFFVCPRESKDKARCDFFKWLDAAEPTAAWPPAKGHVSGPFRRHVMKQRLVHCRVTALEREPRVFFTRIL